MQTKCTFILSLGLLFSLWSCSSNSSQENPQPEVVVDSSQKSTPNEVQQPVVTETSENLKTLEGFWSVFQKAVMNRDIEKIEALFAPNAQKYRFGQEDYQAKISAATVNDITDSGREEAGEKIYQFMMIFEPTPEGKEEGQEDSATTIYFKKNKEGNFEIWQVVEAG